MEELQLEIPPMLILHIMTLSMHTCMRYSGMTHCNGYGKSRPVRQRDVKMVGRKWHLCPPFHISSYLKGHSSVFH